MKLKLDSDVEEEEKEEEIKNMNNANNHAVNSSTVNIPLVTASSVSEADRIFNEHKLKVVDFFHDKTTNILYIRVPFTNLSFMTTALGCDGIYIAKIGAWAFNYSHREEVGKAYKTALKEYGV